MSTKTKELANVLGAKGTEDTLSAIVLLSALDNEQCAHVSTYLAQRTPADNAEVTSVANIVSSKIPISTAQAAYQNEVSVAGFLDFLAISGRVILYQDETVTVSIGDPTTDIVVELIEHDGNMDSKTFRVYFLVTCDVSGFGSVLKFQSQASVYNYTAKNYATWLMEIITQCRDGESDDPDFFSSLDILHDKECIDHLLSDPSEDSMRRVKDYFTLLHHLEHSELGDNIFEDDLVKELVIYLRDELTTRYRIKQKVDAHIVECLFSLGDTLDFPHSDDFIVVRNRDTPKAGSVLITKEDGEWIRSNKGHQAYQRVMLADSLQK